MDNPWIPLHLMIEQIRKKKMADEFGQLADSGQRRTFETGAMRDRGELKPRPDLISPHAQLREGMIMAKGAEKYALRNWEKGIPISECLASAQRHIEQFKRGDRDEDHIAQARWNLGVIIHFEEEIKAGRLPTSLDDMPRYIRGACPTCGEKPVRSFQCAETGLEYTCDECGWNSLDASPKFTPVPPTFKGLPITYMDIESDQPTFYVAGPMRGYENLNFLAFDRITDFAVSKGFGVISPANLDRLIGIDPLINPDSIKYADAPGQMARTAKRDINAICSLNPDKGDGLILLPKWEDSTGARAEVALALWLGLKFMVPVAKSDIDPDMIQYLLERSTDSIKRELFCQLAF